MGKVDKMSLCWYSLPQNSINNNKKQNKLHLSALCDQLELECESTTNKSPEEKAPQSSMQNAFNHMS